MIRSLGWIALASVLGGCGVAVAARAPAPAYSVIEGDGEVVVRIG